MSVQCDWEKPPLLPFSSLPVLFTYTQRAHELRNGAASAADEGRRTQQAFPSDPCAC